MKTWLAVAAGAVALWGVQAQAQNAADQRWGGGWGQIPPGSYQQSCRDFRLTGPGVLSASCQDNRGRWNYSTINVRDCRGDIRNDGGRLACGWGDGGGWGQLPSGSYQESCRDARVNGSGRNATLSANCRDNRGRWNFSTIRFNDCRGGVINDNGRLACESGWGGGGGGRAGELMLFSAPEFGGQAFQATREVTNLPRQFNDRAMSLRIEGRGAWQVCSDSDFRGRCQIFDRDVPDLRRYGLGEAISSMRPVSGRPY